MRSAWTRSSGSSSNPAYLTHGIMCRVARIDGTRIRVRRQGDERITKRVALRLFGALPEEVQEARQKLKRNLCPRRYCWYWHSLSFDWQLKPEEGCRVADEHPSHALPTPSGAAVAPWRQCCRASGNAHHPDFYEPREPHLKADGWPKGAFCALGKEHRRRLRGRRKPRSPDVESE